MSYLEFPRAFRKMELSKMKALVVVKLMGLVFEHSKRYRRGKKEKREKAGYQHFSLYVQQCFFSETIIPQSC